MFHNRIPRFLLAFSSMMVAMLLATAAAATASGDSDPATIIISVEAPGAGSTQFNFHGSLGNFSLRAGESAQFSVEVEHPIYVVYQEPVEGWEATRIECDTDAYGSWTFLNELQLYVQSGQTYPCTFTIESRPLAKNVQLVGQFGGRFNALAAQGNYAYLGEGPQLAVLDISDPAQPVVVGRSGALPGEATDVAVQGSFAYVTSGLEDSNIFTDPFLPPEGSGLHIFDMSDPSRPIEVGSLLTHGEGSSVVVSGSRLVIGDGYGGLHFIDVTDPTAPRQVGYVSAGDNEYSYGVVAIEGDLLYAVLSPEFESPVLEIFDISDLAQPQFKGWLVTGPFSNPFGSGKYICASTQSGLNIIDLSDVSDPFDPDIVASVEMGGGLQKSIAVEHDVAYVATRSDGVWIIDVSDPVHPVVLGHYEEQYLSDGIEVWWREVAVAGDLLFVTDRPGGVHILDASNPADLFEMNFFDVPLVKVEQTAAASLESLLVWEGFRRSNLQTVDISEPTAPALSGFALQQPGVEEMVSEGGYAYLVDGDLRIFSLANSFAPTEVGSLQTPGHAADVAVQGSFAYVADRTGGLRIVNISDPTVPKEAGAADVYAGHIAVDGGYAYALSADRLIVIDISNPQSAHETGHIAVYSSAVDVQAGDGYAYVLDGIMYSHQLHIIDSADPTSPVEVASLDLPYLPETKRAHQLVLDGAILYVADGWYGVRVIDVSVPTAPVEVGYYNTAGDALDVALVDPYVAAADGYGGVLLLRYVPQAERNTITIAKEVDGDASGPFPFTGDMGSFSLSDGDQSDFSALTPGAYTIRETAVTGWALERLVCDSMHVTKLASGVRIDLAEGEHVTCIFHNERLAVTAEAGGPYSGSEGAYISLNARGTTYKELVKTYQWDCHDDGYFEKSSSNPADRSCKYADNGTYTIRLRTTDIFGRTSEDTAAVTVSNAPPAVEVAAVTQAVVGQVVEFSGSFSDPGTADTHTITWDFGDGSMQAGTLTPQHAYAAVGQYVVTLSVTDDDGGTGAATLIAEVVNSAPLLSAITVSPSVIDEGESFTLSGALDDPDGDSVLALLVDWGDGKTVTKEYPAGTKSFSLSHPCADDPPGAAADETYTIKLKLSDEAGAYAEAAVEVEVHNVAPAIDVGVDQSVALGQAADFSAVVSDPGMMDTLTVTWDFGDGSPAVAGVTASHVFATPGSYTVRATVEDDDGGTAVDALTVTVNEVHIVYLPVIAR